MSIGLRDLVLHQRALRTVLIHFWPPRPLFKSSRDVLLQLLADQTLRLARTGAEPVTAAFWAANKAVDITSRRPQRLRAAIFHGASLLCVADGVGVLRNCARVASRDGVQCFVTKWSVGGLDLSAAFWRQT